MKFYTECRNQSIDYCKVRAFKAAKNKILLYKFGADEKILDHYLKQHSHITLKLLCLNILFHTKFYSDLDGKLVISIDDKWDRYAKLITYGNGRMNGSKILIRAFGE